MSEAAPLLSLEETIAQLDDMPGKPRELRASTLHWLRALKTLQVCLGDPLQALGFPAESRLIGHSVSQSEALLGGLEVQLSIWLPPTPEAARWANQLMRTRGFMGVSGPPF